MGCATCMHHKPVLIMSVLCIILVKGKEYTAAKLVVYNTVLMLSTNHIAQNDLVSRQIVYNVYMYV